MTAPRSGGHAWGRSPANMPQIFGSAMCNRPVHRLIMQRCLRRCTLRSGHDGCSLLFRWRGGGGGNRRWKTVGRGVRDSEDLSVSTVVLEFHYLNIQTSFENMNNFWTHEHFMTFQTFFKIMNIFCIYENVVISQKKGHHDPGHFYKVYQESRSGLWSLLHPVVRHEHFFLQHADIFFTLFIQAVNMK